MPVELHSLVVCLLRIAEERRFDVLAGRDPKNRLRADPLMDVQRNGVHLEPPLLALVRPLQPRLLIPKGLAKLRCLCGRQRLPLRLLQKFRELVRLTGGVETQHRSEPRAVLVPNLRHEGNGALCRNLCRRIVLSSRLVVPIIGDIAERALDAASPVSSFQP